MLSSHLLSLLEEVCSHVLILKKGEKIAVFNAALATLAAEMVETMHAAAGIGAMLGLDIPVIPVEHQYIVTEPHPAILERKAKGLPEMGVLRESDSSWYMREENGGLLLGHRGEIGRTHVAGDVHAVEA